jgi:Ubiquitin carboxyl-terminal hydrolase
MYDLYAVSNHFGGLGGGHYTAFVNLPGTGDDAGAPRGALGAGGGKTCSSWAASSGVFMQPPRCLCGASEAHCLLKLAVCPPGGWFNFDDSRVTGPLSDSEIVCSSAYLLFYRRREETQKDDGTHCTKAPPAHLFVDCTVHGVCLLLLLPKVCGLQWLQHVHIVDMM